jgi:NAD(P)-dependent dehydrogenase (short-subunit alcohol dehydrogenase family)
MLDGMTAFVTGASQGIGRDIATSLADNGANVALAARSDTIYEVRDEIGAEQALPVETDVTDEANIKRSIEKTVDEFGGLDCLVNNAGVSRVSGTAGDHSGGPIESMAVDEWQFVQDVNVLGTVLCSKHAIPHLRESDRASIINIGSIGGKHPYPNGSAYAASKMAVIGFTRTLAFEVGDDGITANTICPGATIASTGDRLQNIWENRAEAEGIPVEQAKQESLTDQALNEVVHGKEVGELACFLASPAGKHITAQDINIDSGASSGD